MDLHTPDSTSQLRIALESLNLLLKVALSLLSGAFHLQYFESYPHDPRVQQCLFFLNLQNYVLSSTLMNSLFGVFLDLPPLLRNELPVLSSDWRLTLRSFWRSLSKQSISTCTEDSLNELFATFWHGAL